MLISAGVVVAHANLCLLIPLRSNQYWIRLSTIGAAILTAVCIDVLAIVDMSGDSTIGRLAGAAAIAAGSGTLAMAIMLKYNRSAKTVDDTDTEITEITIFCPRCQSKQTIGLGHVCCSRCDLRLQIHIDTSQDDSANAVR